MSISLFSYDVNPSVDPRLCRKSNHYVAQLVRAGRAFMLDERRAQLYAPVSILRDAADSMCDLPVIRGRNSCAKITNKEGELMRYVVRRFSYPVPAHGARSRPMYAKVVNKDLKESNIVTIKEPK